MVRSLGFIAPASRRHVAARLAVVALVLLAAGGAASLLAAAPAAAYDDWEHDGAVTCGACHEAGVVTSARCEACHTGGYTTTGTNTCWTCHTPGQDMSAYQSSAGCTAVCHIRRDNANIYDVAYSHGPAPHDGADFAPCLDCHGVSVSFDDPDDSPHHDAVVQQAPTCQQCHNGVIASAVDNHDSVSPACTSCHNGMNIPAQPATCTACHAAATFGVAVCTDCHSAAGTMHLETVHTTTPTVPACTQCHTGYQEHAGKVTCVTCHTRVATFHHGMSADAGKKDCTSCHTKRHAGKKIALAKCAKCHTGNAPAAKPRAQHSLQVKKKKTCSACHTKALHAKAFGSGMTCSSCHKGRFHAQPTIPKSGRCLDCHAKAARHQVGFACVMCHRSAIHNARPSAGSH
jgi:hypothetical protein